MLVLSIDFKDLEQLFGPSYWLFWRESQLAFWLLAMLSAICCVVIWVHWKAKPKTYPGIEAWIRKEELFKYRIWAKPVKLAVWLFKYPRGTVALVMLLFLLQWAFAVFGESWFLKFKPGRTGILLADFTGPDLSSMLGGFGIRQAIETQIAEYADRRIGSQIDVRFSNKSFRNQEDARRWRQKQRAAILIWGSSEKGTDSLTVWLNYELLNSFQLNTPFASGKVKVGVPSRQILRLPLDKGGRSPSLLNWIEFYSLVSLVTASWNAGHYELCNGYVDQLQDVPTGNEVTASFFCNAFRYQCHTQLEEWAEALTYVMRLDSLAEELGDAPPSLVHSVCWSGIGLCSERLNDKAKAIEAYERAVDYDSLNEAARLHLAAMLLLTKRYEEAASTSARGLELDSGNYKLEWMLAEGLAMTGRCLEALPHFRNVHAEDDSLGGGISGMIWCFANLGVHDSCFLYLKEYERKSNGLPEDLRFLYVRCLIMTGALQEADKMLSKYLDEYPCFHILLLDLARELDKAGQRAQAKAKYAVFNRAPKQLALSCAERYHMNASVFEGEATRLYQDFQFRP